jgi:23S rRNA (guanine745-N1)-methyltransferase
MMSLSPLPGRASPADIFSCPIDATPLRSVDGVTLVCAHGHSFDRAREGHVNLLVVQHKASRDPGDSKPMVAARRRILDAGHFAPLAAYVSAMVCRVAAGLPSDSRPIIVDAGCGEGYYLGIIAKALTSTLNDRPQLAGIDISKWAIHAAAKRYAGCAFAVATNRHLPFAPGSVDLIVSMFGFPIWDCFAGIQSPAGLVLMVDPGPDHLRELRKIIYPVVNRSEPPSLEGAQSAGYQLADEHRLEFPFELTSAEQIADLLTMTPHNYRAPLPGRMALAELDRLSLTGDVVVRLLRRLPT